MSDVTQQNPEEHVWATEQMAAAAVGGLSGEELSRFHRHLSTCEQCNRAWSQLRDDEQELTRLFENARPPAGLEDRVIQNLRTTRQRRLRIHPAIRFATTGIAAALIVGTLGLVVDSALRDPAGSQVASNLPQFAQAPLISSNENKGLTLRGVNMYRGATAASSQPAAPAQIAPPDAMASTAINRYVTALATNTTRWDVSRRTENQGVYFKTEPSNQTDRGTVSLGTTLQWGDQSNHDYTVQAPGAKVPQDAKDVALNYGGYAMGGEVKSAAPDAYGLTVAKPVEKSGAGTLTIAGGSAGSAGELGSARGGQTWDWFKPAELGRADPKQLAEAKGTIKEVELQIERVPGLAVVGQKVAPVLQPPAQVALAVPEPAAAPPLAPQVQAASRKIIRTGEMTFEVERFDSAFAIVSKLVTEAGGYIGSTNSEKLPNGKVKGTVAVRVPPERLDTLVLQLRSLGELKSQKLEAQDISKQYTDLEGELKAARAMEERLLEIIKTGKGEIKDLLAAEKELGVWRGKIEKIVGEMKFYDNQVALSTLAITLFEKDVNTVAAATETESIDAGIESSDVEKARAEALKAIDEAKGRVVQSELKKFDAGQFGATIVADVAADRAGPLLDRIKQLGKVARLEVQRKQTNSESGPATRVERKDTRFNLSIYNLANVAPRVATTMALAADDAEATYRAVLTRVTKAGGRIISSNLTRPKNEQISGTIAFELPADQADAVTVELKQAGEVMNLAVAENPDTANTTTAKRGFALQILAVAGVAPRETANVALAATSVADARTKILEAARAAGARILTSQLNESDQQNVTATLDLEIKRDKLPDLDKAFTAAGDIVSRTITRSPDTENTIDSKVRMTLSLVGADRIPPRESTTLGIEVRDVESALADIQSTAATAGGKITQSNLSKDREGRTLAKVVVDVPHDKANDLIAHTRSLGTVRVFDSARNPQAPEGKLARSRIEITFGNAEAIVAPGQGVWASVRNALATSAAGLLWSLQIVIIGLCFVLPWALLLWAGWKFARRGRKTEATAV